MASQVLSKTIDKLETFIQRSKGAVGGARIVSILNNLIEIQRHIQDNPKSVKAPQQVIRFLNKIREQLELPEKNL